MARTARPMIEMTGVIADVQVGDYVDTVGDGRIYRQINVSALVHKIGEHGLLTRNGVVPVTVYEFLGKGTHRFAADAVVKFRRFADQAAS